MKHRACGQALPLLALMLPALSLFVIVIIELSSLWLEVAVLEDALQQATRSAVQQLDYAVLAQGQQALRGNQVCQAVTIKAPGPCAAIVTVGYQFLIANLQTSSLVSDDSRLLAETTRWTVLPRGGTCAGVTATTPLLCAELQPTLPGIFGWGSIRPHIRAADTIDRLE